MRRGEEARAAGLTEMATAAKARKSKGEAGDGNSSHGGRKSQAVEGAARKDLGGDNLAGLDALTTAAKELHKEEEVGEVAGSATGTQGGASGLALVPDPI